MKNAVLIALAWPAAALAAPDFVRDVKPVLETHCFKCHADGKKKGGFTFDAVKTTGGANEIKLWETVLENVRSGAMPPDDEEKQPTLEEREKIQHWIEATVFAVDPDKPDPGRVTLRRLNRVEYNNTIRDLTGVDFRPADDFPADDSGYGFDNIGDALTLPPVLFERYLSAAEKIMSRAILNDHKPRPQIVKVDLTTVQGGPGGSTVNSKKVDDRESSISADFPVAGDYTVKVQLTSNKIGDAATRVEWKFDGKNVRTADLGALKDKAEAINISIPGVKPGPHKLTMRVVNPLANPPTKNGRPEQRSFTIRELRFISPPQPVKATPTQARLFSPGRGQPNLEYAARAILRDFSNRAFRRPAQPQEVERFVFIWKTAGKKGANFEQSIQTAMTAVLVSPHFLFRSELQPQPDEPKTVHTISDWALASRLSYFLWSTMPDDALFAAAANGTLRKNLPDTIKRMVADPKAAEFVENFTGQWLQLRNLRLAQPDKQKFPEWDKPLAAAMERETEMLFDHILRQDRPVIELLATDYTFVNERLARHYDIDGIEGDAFVKVPVNARRPGGVLGHASFLTLTSNPNRTSPVKRGKYVLDNLLATPPPPAPPDVPDIDDAKRAELVGTLRQRMEKHRVEPLCASCHARMDPIGFGLENFDGIGAWREKDGDAPVDSAGELVSGEKFKDAADLRQILLTSKRRDFFRAVTEKTMTYALGRGLEYYDRPTVDRIVKTLETGPGKMSDLLLAVAQAPAFQTRRGDGDPRKK